MAKEIRIILKNCIGCPYTKFVGGPGSWRRGKRLCTWFVDKKPEVINEYKIPCWCPLPDAEEADDEN